MNRLNSERCTVLETIPQVRFLDLMADEINCADKTADCEEDENKNYIRRERVYGKYERSFYLGDLDQDKIDATFDNGCLKITVPKKAEVDNRKVIEIK